jgi:hypothetical protein
LQTPSSTFKLVQILRACGNAFPAAADAIIPFIRPEDPRRHTSIHSLSEADDILYSASPQKMLDLLAAVVGDVPARTVFGLNKALDRLRTHAPALADTRKFQKLVNAAGIHSIRSSLRSSASLRVEGHRREIRLKISRLRELH